MIATHSTVPSPSKAEAVRLLADTAQAVKVMKASWLHVALNLKQIREHELWRLSSPPCESYAAYTLDVLKLNKYVAGRMLQAMEYTREHRPDIVEDFRNRGDSMDVPSYEVVNQLRRVERSFEDRKEDLGKLRSRVFDDGIGRIVLKREIDSKLGKMDTGKKITPGTNPEPATLREVIQQLLEIEKRLLDLKTSKPAQKLLFQLVEVLQKESGGGSKKS